MARVFLTVYVLVLGFAVSWAGAGAEAEKAKPAGESPQPAVTLRTLIVGTCQEVQRYAESVVGSGVLRSAAEVQTGGVHSHMLHSCLFDTCFSNILFCWLLGLTPLFDLSLFLLNNCT